MGRNGMVSFVSVPTATATLILPLNRARLAFYVFPPSGGVSGEYITISNDPNVSAGAGLVIYVGSSPVLFDCGTFGDLVNQPWFAKLVAADTRLVGVAEAVRV